MVNYLGFLDEEGKLIWLLLDFLGVEEKTNYWCGKKRLSIEVEGNTIHYRRINVFIIHQRIEIEIL